MRKLKIATIVGTRPEIIRLSRVIPKLDEYCDHALVHTGQNYDYELNQIFFEDLQIRKPDHFLDAAGATSAQTIGNVIIEVDRVLEELRPEAVLILGDTNSCLAVIPAKRRKIATFHMEAGNRCFDMRVPEEVNRRIVDHVADVNLTYSAIAREYLLREGIPPRRVIRTGSPMAEVLEFNASRIEGSTIVERLGLKRHEFLLVSAHREENIDPEAPFRNLVSILNTLADELAIPVVVSTHPRTKKRIDDAGINLHKRVKLMRPLGFHDFVKLQVSSMAVLSDSGTITEESSILNFPALNLRESHERPEGMEEGTVMMVGLNIARIRQGLSILAAQGRGAFRTLNRVQDYEALNVSEKVLRIVHSYTDYVARDVWKNY